MSLETSGGPPKIVITSRDVSDPRVDEALARENAIRQSWVGPDDPRAQAARGVEQAERSFYFAGVAWTALAGGLGAFIGWALFEPVFSDSAPDDDPLQVLAGFLMMPLIGGLMGLFIGALDGVRQQAFGRAARCGAIGLGVGFVGGLVSGIAANIVFGITIAMGVSIKPEDIQKLEKGEVTAYVLLLLMVARSVGWAIFGVPLGLGQGIALKSKKLMLNGFIGGLLGGFLGGLAFDPIDRFLNPGMNEEAWVSRLVAFTFVGASTGFFIGLVEQLARDAWLHMVAGPLAGKQFVIYKDPTVLGSSPKCDVYLFKDPKIEPRHAEVRKVGREYELEDVGPPGGAGIVLNGRRVTNHRLRDGDQIRLGETVLNYFEKERRRNQP